MEINKKHKITKCVHKKSFIKDIILLKTKNMYKKFIKKFILISKQPEIKSENLLKIKKKFKQIKKLFFIL